MDRDQERANEAIIADLSKTLLTADGSTEAFKLLIALREVAEPLFDRVIGSGCGFGQADMSVEVGGKGFSIVVTPIS